MTLSKTTTIQEDASQLQLPVPYEDISANMGEIDPIQIYGRVKKPSKTDAATIGLFAGCGGLDLGFHQEGFEVVWANEFNRWAADSYEKNFLNSTVDRRDVEDLDPYNDDLIPDADLILGGFPCQDFSIIWKRPGLNGERGNLYTSLLRFVDAKKPKAFVAENVRGLLSANKGKAIEQIIQDFSKIEPGYQIHIKLFDFADYGIPQFRHRVVIVGIRLDTEFLFQFPGPTHGAKVDRDFFTAGESLDALGGVHKVALNSEHMNIAQRTRKIISLIREGGNFSDIPTESPYYVKGMISHVYRRIRRDEPAKTLIAGGGGGTWGYHYPENRALTNRERARLQTFPDWFEFVGSFGEIRRQIGNAVPPLGARYIARSLKPLFQGDYERTDLQELDVRLNAQPTKKRIMADKMRG